MFISYLNIVFTENSLRRDYYASWLPCEVTKPRDYLFDHPCISSTEWLFQILIPCLSLSHCCVKCQHIFGFVLLFLVDAWRSLAFSMVFVMIMEARNCSINCRERHQCFVRQLSTCITFSFLIFVTIQCRALGWGKGFVIRFLKIPLLGLGRMAAAVKPNGLWNSQKTFCPIWHPSL